MTPRFEGYNRNNTKRKLSLKYFTTCPIQNRGHSLCESQCMIIYVEFFFLFMIIAFKCNKLEPLNKILFLLDSQKITLLVNTSFRSLFGWSDLRFNCLQRLLSYCTSCLSYNRTSNKLTTTLLITCKKFNLK